MGLLAALSLWDCYKKMRPLRAAVIAVALLGLPSAAFAACTSPLSINVGPSTQNFGTTLDGSSNCYGNYAIVDGTNAANKATVNASGALLTTQTGALPAGTNLLGKLGIDQTTPGTTNAVQVTNFPTGLTATSNALDVNLKTPATVTVAGTVSVSGVATLAGQTAVQAVMGAGTAPASMNAAGGQYRATPPTLTDLQSVALQLGVNGGLIIDPTNLTIASTSTTAGQRGSLTMAAVTAGNPSYNTAQTNYLSLTLAGGLRVDNTSVAGTVIDTNAGNASAGTQRFVLATNQAQFATPLNVRPTDGTNATVVKATGASAGVTDNSMVVAVSPNPTAVCPNRVAINQLANTDILTSTNKIYICSLDLVIGGTETVSIVEGTGLVCATGTTALWGGTTADATHGMPFSANGGIAKTADRPFAVSLTTGDHICILKSGPGLLSGSMWYVDHS